MAKAIRDQHEEETWFPTGQQLASRVFAIGIAGLFAVIAMMIVLGERW